MICTDAYYEVCNIEWYNICEQCGVCRTEHFILILHSDCYMHVYTDRIRKDIGEIAGCFVGLGKLYSLRQLG